mgnify:FL=1
MKANAERMKCVILKAAVLKERREKRNELFCKAACVILSCLLAYSIGSIPELYKSAAVAGYCGAILMIDGMGGYVLTAVVTFIAATAITVICIKIKNRRNQK